MKKLNSKNEGTIAIIVAIFVMFSATWDPMVSVAISIAALVLFGIYKFLGK